MKLLDLHQMLLEGTFEPQQFMILESILDAGCVVGFIEGSDDFREWAVLPLLRMGYGVKIDHNCSVQWFTSDPDFLAKVIYPEEEIL